MKTRWRVMYCLMLVFLSVEAWLFWWADLPENRGQAMPSAIFPVGFAVLGLGFFSVYALAAWLIKR